MATFWFAFGSIVLLVVLVTFSIGEVYRRRDRKSSFGFIRWSVFLLVLMAVFAYFVFSLNTIVPTGYPKVGYQFSEQWASILHEEKIGETEYIFWIVREENNQNRVVKILKESLHPTEYAKKEKCQIPKYECLLQSTAHGIVIKIQTKAQEVKEGGE